MKYLFIILEIQDGEREYEYRLITTTNCKNILFAAEWYAAHFWGIGEKYSKEDDFWWFDNEITIRLAKVEEITDKQYQYLNELFSH